MPVLIPRTCAALVSLLTLPSLLLLPGGVLSTPAASADVGAASSSWERSSSKPLLLQTDVQEHLLCMPEDGMRLQQPHGIQQAYQLSVPEAA